MVQKSVGELLLPILEGQTDHESRAGLIRRSRVTDVRDTCGGSLDSVPVPQADSGSDGCMTSLLSAAWMCQYCGWETCDDCYKFQCTSTDAGAADPTTKVSQVHVCVSGSLCLRKGKKKNKDKGKTAQNQKKQATTVLEIEDGPSVVRTIEDFLPISRFQPGELENLIKAVKSLPEPPIVPEYVPSDNIAATMARADTLQETIRIPAHEMSNELLDYLWSQDDPYPFVVTDVTRDLQYSFSPDFFREYEVLSKQECIVQNCQTGEEYTSTVAEFFSRYGDQSDDRQPERLKVNFSVVRPCSIVPPLIITSGLAAFVALQVYVPLFEAVPGNHKNPSCEGLHID